MNRAVLTACILLPVLVLAPARSVDKPSPEPTWKLDLSTKGATRKDVTWVGFTPDGHHLCARTDSLDPDLWEREYRLRIWDLESKKERLLLAHRTLPIRVPFGPECAFLGSERLIVSGYVLDLEGKKQDPPPLWEKNPRSHGSAIWTVGKDHIFAVQIRETSLLLRRWTTWLVRGTPTLGVTGRVDLKTKDNLPIQMATLSPDGKQLAAIFSGSSNRSGTLKLYSVDFNGPLKLEEKGEVQWPHKGTTHSLQFSPNGETLASTGDEGTLKLWRTEKAAKDWKPYATVALPGGWELPFYCTAFRADGRIIAFGTSKRTGSGVGLVDVETGKLINQFATDSDVISLAFSPNGKLLATGGFNGMLHLWDVHTILTGGENE
jgi:WD40 repeat protein